MSASVALLAAAVVRLDLDSREGRVLPDPLEGPVRLLPLVVAHAAPVGSLFSDVVRFHVRSRIPSVSGR